MNGLSLMLYLADVISSVGSFLTAFGILTSSLLAGTLAICIICRENNRHYGESDTDFRQADALVKKTLKFLPWTVAILLFSMFFPSKQTAYMMIASEMGQEVASTETGQKALAALNRYLDSIGTEEQKK